jgi:hypothetical protein
VQSSPKAKAVLDETPTSKAARSEERAMNIRLPVGDALSWHRHESVQCVSNSVSQSRRLEGVVQLRKYGFEKIDGDTLKKEPLNSPGFIQFCELG